MALHVLVYDRLPRISKLRQSPERLGLSDIVLPWMPFRNACAKVAEAACRERSIEIGMLATRGDVRRFDAFVTAAAHVFPTADQERLEACADFCAWLWYMDDTYDENPAFGRDVDRVRIFMEAHLDVLRHGCLPPDHGPLAAFTSDLRARLIHLSRSRPAWFPRFVASVERYLVEGSLRAMQNWSTNAVPTLDTYLEQREHDSAVYACIDLIEVAAEAFISDEARGSPAITEMRRITARVVALSNDLFSYEREVLRQGDPNNIVAVLMTHRRISFEEAVDQVVRLLDADVRRFREIERGLAPQRALRTYIEGMKHWMRGNHTWSMKTARYRSPVSPFPELRVEPIPPSSRRVQLQRSPEVGAVATAA